MIKKFKIETLLFCFLLSGMFLFYNTDISIYKIFNENINTDNYSYFKSFFINITEVGDSIWYFLISLIVFMISFFLKKNKKNYLKLRNSSLFIFLALLISGIITQILKHIIGRPRPKYADFENILNFDFFTLNSSFHSFPSGHTSTIFVIALCLSIIFPRIRYVLLFFASLVAFSRVVVGAHFLTDVIGGVIISVFALKLTIILFERFKIYKPLSVLNKINSDIVLLSIFIFIILVVFLAIGSDLDIYISSLFYLEEKRFFLQSYFKITIFFRKILLPFIVLYLTILPFFCIFLPIEKIYFGFKFKIKDALLVFFCFVFNLVLITNLLLKDLWGRARPNEIIELGGIHNFSPWYMISDSCNKNCSFISGDAAVGFSIILLFVLTKNKLFFWCSVLFGSSIGFIRVLEGGHFLSDITMSGMIIFLLSYIQVCFYKKKYEKKIL